MGIRGSGEMGRWGDGEVGRFLNTVSPSPHLKNISAKIKLPFQAVLAFSVEVSSGEALRRVAVLLGMRSLLRSNSASLLFAIAFTFVVNVVVFINNIKTLVTNALMFSMDGMMSINNVKTLVTNVLMFSMDGLALINKEDKGDKKDKEDKGENLYQ
ncbi:hypothetical protein CEN44_20070 [Fischerella muscicola CCMEE 5323]|uniref:Uncharacterized protein n=1 Tax=Fischerella muscicola CCMEE 5323 TaxID=2019572 RepID=A0A2N6JZ09_FISMU|nr:hypothetical protein CEN44_20070 [Fischerella muscicola CCMEE 5323]